MRIAFCTLAIVVTLAGCTHLDTSIPSRESRTALELVRTGSTHLLKGRRAKALQIFDRAAATAPSDFAVMAAIIAALQSSDLQTESIVYIVKAIDLPSRTDELDRIRDSQLYTILGDTYWSRGLHSLARRAYHQAIELNADNAMALNNLGYQYADAGENLEEALRLVTRAVELEPKNGVYIDSLGWAYFRLGRYDDAVSTLRRAVELCPSDAEVRYHLGMAYEKCRNRNGARVEYLKALELKPSYPEAQSQISRLGRR